MYKGQKLLRASALAITLYSPLAQAYMPSSPSGYDSFRTSTGVECRSSVGGAVNVYGELYSSNTDYPPYNNEEDKGGRIGVSISLGGGDRIDCSRLQEIETRKAELELEKLEAEVEMLKKLKDLNALQASGVLPKL